MAIEIPRDNILMNLETFRVLKDSGWQGNCFFCDKELTWDNYQYAGRQRSICREEPCLTLFALDKGGRA